MSTLDLKPTSETKRPAVNVSTHTKTFKHSLVCGATWNFKCSWWPPITFVPFNCKQEEEQQRYFQVFKAQ